MLEHGSKVRIVFVMLSVILQLNRRMTILIEASYEYGDGQKCQFRNHVVSVSRLAVNI